MRSLDSLLTQVRSCTLCAEHLEHGVRPVLQISPQATVLIVGQAPGRKVHESGIPFDDASGDRLRDWLGITKDVFYDPDKVAILPMGFCFPGTGKSGDLAPRAECAPAWREQLLAHLPHLKVTILVGQYAQKYHIEKKPASLTATVQAWQSYWPEVIPLPHPSPRNNIWLSKNPWFKESLIPRLRVRVAEVLGKETSINNAV